MSSRRRQHPTDPYLARQYLAYGALSAGALGLTAAVVRSHAALFRQYFGGLDPLGIVALAALLGLVALALLRARGPFEVFRGGRRTVHGVARAALFATLLAVAVIVADLLIRFPADMNVPPPEALLFYPAIGFVVEIVFHVLPLALSWLALGWLLKGAPAGRAGWLSLALVSLLEPTFQLALEDDPLSWGGAYVWLHVLVLNLLQLWIFRRYDFVCMYSLRLVYYFYWHIAWGVARLELLF